MSIAQVHAVTAYRGETAVLRDITVELGGRTVAVIGENGSGKSSFALLLAGLIQPETGHLSVLGVDARREQALLRQRTAMIFSNPDTQILMPTVAEDIAFSIRRERLPASVAQQRVRTALDRFGLTEYADHSAHDLSGGQKQLLALCGAFIRSPDLLIADEPTAFLDARNARLIADHLFADTGHRLVVVTHDLELAARCETAVLFENGRVLRSGETGSVVDEYRSRLVC